MNHDVSVPVSQTPAFLDRANAAMERACPGVRIVAFGHMGDGNFHYSVMQPETMSADLFPGAAGWAAAAAAAGLAPSGAAAGVGAGGAAVSVTTVGGLVLMILKAMKPINATSSTIAPITG